MAYTPEKRRTYIQLKDELKGFAGLFTQKKRNEPLTCRASVNIGLELVLAGLELLRAHGIEKERVVDFIDKIYDVKGDVKVRDMAKGGKEEGLLRTAMSIINGPIVRHANDGTNIEDAALPETFTHDHVIQVPDVLQQEVADDKPVDRKAMNSDIRFN